MKATLNEQEIMKAVTLYMALRGLEVSRNFTFGRNRNSEYTIDVNIIGHKNYNLESVKKTAMED